MPIYDYVCANCRHLTEVIHGINDAGPRFCPACGADGTMRKALSSPAIHFKGSGWAKKDRSAATASRTKAAANTGSGDKAAGDKATGDGAAGNGSTSREATTTTSSAGSSAASTTKTGPGED